LQLIYTLSQKTSGCARMRRLKPLLSILPLALSASTAMAADYRWTSSYDQGTLEATIWNRNASNIVIYCPEGQEDTTPGMFLEVKRIKPQRGESVTVQIVVDGDSFPFELNEIQFTASSRAEKWRFFALVDALVASKQKVVRGGVSEILCFDYPLSRYCRSY
jgi:hypothetical protein